MDAETAPLEHPEYYQYDLDIPQVAEVWRRGSVVGSWLLDLTAASLQKSGDLSDFEGRVSDSGEGRWTSIAAIEEGVPAGVLTTALYERFASRDLDDFADRVLSAMRYQFGGHQEKKDGVGAHKLEVLDDVEAVHERGAELIAEHARAAVAERGACALAVSGGRDPWPMFSQLEDLEMDWTKTEIFQVDERVAPAGSDQRNLTHLIESLSIGAQGSIRPCRSATRTWRPRPTATPSHSRRRSTLPTSASGQTGTRRRWCPATRCSRSPTSGWR